MSLATSIKEFSDTVNNLHTVKTSLPILPFLQEILLFSAKTIVSGIVYILTFEWFRDISYLPLLNPTSPQQFEIANAERLLFPNLTFSHLGDPSLVHSGSQFLSFSNASKNPTNYMVSGLINSFFFSLPFSLSHLISIRRLFSQGIQAAFASLVGIVAAHSLFLISIFYGLRSILIPWFSLEPVTYILGFLLNVLIIKELIQASIGKSSFLPRQTFGMQTRGFQESSYAGTDSSTTVNLNPIEKVIDTFFGSWFASQPINKEIKKFKVSFFLLRISLLSFGLTWCEELNVFSSITNLTLNAQNSYLDLYPSSNASNSLLVHTIYVVAFVVGNCGFSIFFYYLLFKSGSVIASWTNLSSTRVTATINRFVMLLILTFTFSSFPYYGLDYLVGKVGGFLPEDPIYKETVLSPTKITVNKKNTLFIKAESADKKKHSSLLDINNFDNGVYLNNIDFNKLDNFPSDSKSSITRNTSFEKSNYRQENAWIRRNYLARLRARPRKNSENSSTASFYKAFKDPKAYYQKIQLESDKKQSKNMRDVQAKRQHVDSVSRQEGVLADEPVSKMQEFWDQILGLPRDNVLHVLKQRAHTQLLKTESTLDFNESSRKNEVFADRFITDPDNIDRTTNLSTKLFSDNTQKENSFDPETTIFAEKYTKGVKQKSSPPLLKKTNKLSTKNIIKRKFFLNPVYRSLLQTDIDAFMARQPLTHKIAENQEYLLYNKRLMLERYYNWLRYYSPLQNNLQDLYNISETKSFVDSVFHHQFKGTLKIAKRLFPVTFDSRQNNKKNRVLSYDQTLYNPFLHEKDYKGLYNPLLHEELAPGSKESDMKTKLTPKQKNNQHKEQAFRPKQSFDKCQDEDTTGQTASSPFMEESDISPLYAGWDLTLRRFVITNKFFVER